MAGTFRSAKKAVLAHLKRQGVVLNTNHARSILSASNDEIPRIDESLGYATDALMSSGHINIEGKGADAYMAAVDDAFAARQRAVDSGNWPEITRPLGEAQILPWAEPKSAKNRCMVNVQYPLSYAMALELGYTMSGRMHPQAFFLKRAVDDEFDDFLKSWRDLVRSIESITVESVLQDKIDRARRREQRHLDRQLKQNNVPALLHLFEQFDGDIVDFTARESHESAGWVARQLGYRQTTWDDQRNVSRRNRETNNRRAVERLRNELERRKRDLK
jgi:hypothetical protein